MTEFLYLLIVLGSLQGVISGLLLWISRPFLYRDRLLALIIWITALPGFHLYLHYKKIFATTGFAALLHAIVPWILVTALGPLLLFYTRAVRDPRFRIGWQHAAWFLPVIIDLIPKAIELLHLTALFPSSDTAIGSFIDVYNKYADIPRWMIVAFSIRTAWREVKQADNSNTSMQATSLLWLSRFITVFSYFLIVWLAFLIPYILPVSDQLLQTVGWFPVYIPMAVIIYWLGIHGYISGRQLQAGQLSKTLKNTSADDPGMQIIVGQLTAIMLQQKLYLDPALDLAAVSKASEIPSRSISFALNQHLGKTFNQFLNEFRVDEFKQRSSDLQDLSIAGLAASCGFPSLPTFQRVFKQVTGKSPTEYLRETAS